MPRIRVRDLEIEYEIGGDGPSVLFISGTGGDLRTRPNVFSSPIAERARVLAYDQRGLGQTTVPELQPAMADYADDAAALIDALDFDPVAVIGVSFGGMVAQVALGFIVANHENMGLNRSDDYKALRALATVHQSVGWMTFGALTWAGALMVF